MHIIDQIVVKSFLMPASVPASTPTTDEDVGIIAMIGKEVKDLCAETKQAGRSENVPDAKFIVYSPAVALVTDVICPVCAWIVQGLAEQAAILALTTLSIPLLPLITLPTRSGAG
jgi:hypothetical protein